MLAGTISHGRAPGSDRRYALVDGDTALTAIEIDDMSSRMAAALKADGIAAGDRILVFMDSCWEAIVAIAAAIKAGAGFIPLDSSATAGELVSLLNDSRAAGLVTQSSLVRAAAAAMAEAPSLRLTVIAGCEGAPEIDGLMRFEDAIAEDTATPGSLPGSTDDRTMPAGLVSATDSETVAGGAATVLGHSFSRFLAMVQVGGTLVL
jgi:acyl-CoA synthetase (AMP-forming)/AMP-acid ligase II